MAIVCLGCEHDPGAGALVGAACLACGARLVVVSDGDPLIGTDIDGRFTVLAVLGTGGMGVVYRAEQRSIGREIALKLIDRRVEQDLGAVKRFFREAKLASQLAHPNTVAIIDFGQSQDGRLYIAMELVQGRTLLEEVTDVGALPLARVITIGLQLCEALEVAHGLSIVHRDLKLENVMLAPGGRDHIKILDFGLARLVTEPTSQATASGLISGTPRYMPPEVVLDGAQPAPSQDMYAVGVMLAELATGQPLWTAPTLVGLFTQKLDGTDILGGVPAPLRPIVAALLDADPKARPAAGDLRATLRRLELPEQLRPAPKGTQVPAFALAPTTELEFPEINSGNLVALDELELERVRPANEPASASPRAPAHATQVREAEPVFEPEPDQVVKLDLDPVWMAERSRKQQPPPPPRGLSRRLIAAMVIVCIGLAATIYVVLPTAAPSEADRAVPPPKVEPVTRAEPGRSGSGSGTGSASAVGSAAPVAPPPKARLGRTVAIEIVGKKGATVAIGGRAAGTTPETLYITRGKKPITVTVTTDGVEVTQRIVPDRDQKISFPAP